VQISEKPDPKLFIPNEVELDTSIDGVNLNLKKKIFYWITDLNIIKESSVKYDDIPLICCNGVLLADLINRLEGVILNKLEM
jgi:hypothetical protein